MNEPATAAAGASSAKTVLEITVDNHAGVMVQVCSLFARRVYNVEGILCMPIGDGGESRIWLRVNEDRRLEQLMKQLLKLEDVYDVRRHGASHDVFVRLEEFFH